MPSQLLADLEHDGPPHPLLQPLKVNVRLAKPKEDPTAPMPIKAQMNINTIRILPVDGPLSPRLKPDPPLVFERNHV